MVFIIEAQRSVHLCWDPVKQLYILNRLRKLKVDVYCKAFYKRVLGIGLLVWKYHKICKKKKLSNLPILKYI